MYVKNQHIFPKKSISRFAGHDNKVLVYRIGNKGRMFKKYPDGEVFCIFLHWDQMSESSFGKEIEVQKIIFIFAFVLLVQACGSSDDSELFIEEINKKLSQDLKPDRQETILSVQQKHLADKPLAPKAMLYLDGLSKHPILISPPLDLETHSTFDVWLENNRPAFICISNTAQCSTVVVP